MQYAKYMEEHSHEAVRNVYRRACNIHLPKKPYIHMAWAAFEERQGLCNLMLKMCIQSLLSSHVGTVRRP